MDLSKRLSLARTWFAESGIQAASGGVYSWLNSKTGEGSYLYSEITGYAINLFVQLSRQTQDPQWLHRAQKAFSWLEREALTPLGAYAAGAEIHDPRFQDRKDQVFAFDNGIILHGLCQLYKANRDGQVLARAQSLAKWLVESCLEPSGDLKPLYLLSQRAFHHDGSVWSLSYGGYHAKVAMALVYLNTLDQNPSWLRAARQINDRILPRQESDGRFATYDALKGTNAHPLCYTAEGLWFCGQVLDDRAYLEAARRASHWLLKQIDFEGYVPRLWMIENGEIKNIYQPRVDVLGQSLRLARIFRDAAKSEESLNRLKLALCEWQVLEGPKAQHGGFRYGFTSVGKSVEDINFWVTAFAYQALWLCDSTEALSPFDMV